MPVRSYRYAVVDAFTDVPFRGNPAAVCLLDGGIHDAGSADWMLSVASEFNAPVTAFLAPASPKADAQRFHIRWFTTVTEVELCGHATLAAGHFLLTSGVVGHGLNAIEFVTMSGDILTATKVKAKAVSDESDLEEYCIALDFPVASVVECSLSELPSLPDTLNGTSVVKVCRTSTVGDLMIELSSGEEVARIRPNLVEIQKCARRGVIITGPAPVGSQVDFFTRLFAPNLGVNEDQVCGSVHCALTPYWAKKLGKTSLRAYMASSRGGILQLELHENAQRVRIHGPAVTIMIGTLLA